MQINVVMAIAILSVTVGAVLLFCTYCDYYWLLEIKLGLLRVFISGQVGENSNNSSVKDSNSGPWAREASTEPLNHTLDNNNYSSPSRTKYSRC